jgi:hypothetical protein
LAFLAAAAFGWSAFSAGCASSLAHRWQDPLGFEVRSDFDQQRVEWLLLSEAAPRMRALCELFGVDRLDGLVVSVHDQEGIAVGDDANISGWHNAGEIHVMARWSGMSLEWPSPAATRTLGHELVHALVARAGLSLPRWLEEGVCDVLAASPIGSDGALVLMPNGDREREVRKLRSEGRWLVAPVLLGLRDAYPSDKDLLRPMYAQSASLVFAMLSRRAALTRAALDELAAMTQAQLELEFAAWERALPDTPVAALFGALVRSPDPKVRCATAGELQTRTDDDAWWLAAEVLLADAEVDVRRKIRVGAVYRPAGTAIEQTRYRSFCESTNDQLALAGLAGLAQCGDTAAAVAFLRSLATVDDREWWQALGWIALIVPAADGGRRPLPEVKQVTTPGYVAAFAADLAASIESLGPRLVWDPKVMIYRLR